MTRVADVAVALALVVGGACWKEAKPAAATMASIDDVYGLDRDTAIVVWSERGGTLRVSRSDTTGKPIWSHTLGDSAREARLLDTVVVVEYFDPAAHRPIFSAIALDGSRWAHFEQPEYPDRKLDQNLYETPGHIVRVLTDHAWNWNYLIAYEKRTGVIAWQREGDFATLAARAYGHGVIDGHGVFIDARDGSEAALGSRGCGAGQTYVRIEERRMYLYRDGGLVPTVLVSPFPNFQNTCAIVGDHLVVIGHDGSESIAAVIDGDTVTRTIRLGIAVDLPELLFGSTTRFVPYGQKNMSLAAVDLETGALTHPEHADNAGWPLRAGRSWVFNGPNLLRSFDGESGTFSTNVRSVAKRLEPHQVKADRIWLFDEASHPDGVYPWPGLQVIDAVTLEPVRQAGSKLPRP